MEGLLTPVSTRYTKQEADAEIGLVEVVKKPGKAPKPAHQASTSAEALEILKNEPDYESLLLTLRFLAKGSDGFCITSPGPVTAQLVHTIVLETVPTYWPILAEPHKDKTVKNGKPPRRASDLGLLCSCLRSVTGLNAILLGLKQHIQQSKDTKAVDGPRIKEVLSILLQLLQVILQGHQTIVTVWDTVCQSSSDQLRQKAIWNEFVGVIAGGKLLGIAAEGEFITDGLIAKFGHKLWITNGTLYSVWLAKNIGHWAGNLPLHSSTAWKSCGELLSKSFRLGHSGLIVKQLVDSMILDSSRTSKNLIRLLSVLPIHEQRTFLLAVLKIISEDYLSAPITTEDDPEWWHADATIISSAAGLFKVILAGDEVRREQLVSWLTGSSGAGLGDGIGIRRAVLAALSEDVSLMKKILDKSLQQVGDNLYIKHTPILQQEVHTQVLLLAAGYVHRKSPLHLSMMMRSGAHLNVVSNRLSASSPRAGFLGMAVGEAFSGLADKGDKVMDFKVDEMKTPEAKWYKNLVHVADSVGSLESLKFRLAQKELPEGKHPISKQTKNPIIPMLGSKIIAIEEIETDEEEEVSDEDGLTPYAKPDSDVEDSDEDATLVTRGKPTAPVYIRDLLTYLRDTENYDRQKLGLSTAASLIRRKANFGTEVSTHAEELASLLVGIQDKYEIVNFQDMRSQGMIAVLIALPEKMGQWFSKTFFNGDYSISQRATILTTLGLGARELGGYGAEDSNLSTAKPLPITLFPSKTLPGPFQKYYINRTSSTSKAPPKPLPSTKLDTITTLLTSAMIQPIASSTSPKTQSSILHLNKTTRPLKPRTLAPKPTTNALSKIVSKSFFLPLTSHFFTHYRAYGSTSATNISFNPYLLSLFLKTLSLIFHAAGPNTLALQDMTQEFLGLLLGLRTQAIGDKIVLEAVLFGFLTVLEGWNDKRGLVEQFGREVLEIQGWVDGVFEVLGNVGGEGEDARIRGLAAGVLVRVGECVEKYQALLVGDISAF